MKTSKRILILFSLLLLTCILVTAVNLNFQTRVWILENFSQARMNSGYLSSDGKWMATMRRAGKDPIILIYSTSFPYKRIKVDIPVIKEEAGYSRIDANSWSPNAATLVIRKIRERVPGIQGYCYISILSDATVRTSCYSVPLEYQQGSFAWSIDGYQGGIFKALNDGSILLAILDNDGKIINRKRTPVLIIPKENESIWGSNFLWNGSKFFYMQNYRRVEINHGVMSESHRVEVYSIDTNYPEKSFVLYAEDLKDEMMNSSLVSFDPEKKFILILKQGNNIDEFQVIDTFTGELVQEIPIPIFKGNVSFTLPSYCINECDKTAVRTHIYSGPSETMNTLLLWEWKSRSIRVCDDRKRIVGNLNNQGFLCSYEYDNTFFNKVIMGVDFCQ